MVTTIADFLCSMKKTSLKPLCYFSFLQATSLLLGAAKVKPDILIVPLIDGYLQEGCLSWKNVQSLIEHTLEKKPPVRMSETVQV